MVKIITVKGYLETILRKKGKMAFVKSLKNNASLLDVGCGNNSPSRYKALRPDLYYVGIDIDDYNQSNNPNEVANEYIYTSPDMFSDTISNFTNKFDAVISSHNLEHCNNQVSTLKAMLKALNQGGCLYLSFPSEASISFPKRRGALNFFDDGTHKEVPNLKNVLEVIKSEGCKIDFVVERHRPILLSLLGLLLEPLSMVSRKVMRGTWELYGFESIIWATKTKPVLYP